MSGIDVSENKPTPRAKYTERLPSNLIDIVDVAGHSAHKRDIERPIVHRYPHSENPIS